MKIENYIAELLYRYNCVVVPEFGAFLTQMKSATIQKETNTFNPPRKVVSFNQQLVSNDGLLVSYIANAEKTNYEEALKSVIGTVKKWRQQLVKKEAIEMPQIGELFLNKEGKIQFEPVQSVNFATSSFGLSSFITAPVVRETLKEEVEELEENVPFTITPESKKKQRTAPYLKYAAILLLAFSTGITGYKLYSEGQDKKQLVQQESHNVVSRSIQEATFFDTTPMELPAVNLKVEKKPAIGYYKVVAGAFRIKENADKRILQLKEKGYNASYLGANKYGLHMVAYDSFDDAQEALDYLRTIKQSESPEAWLFQE